MQVKAFTDGSSPLTQLSGGESLELPLASLGCAAQCKCVLSNLSISMRALYFRLTRRKLSRSRENLIKSMLTDKWIFNMRSGVQNKGILI